MSQGNMQPYDPNGTGAGPTAIVKSSMEGGQYNFQMARVVDVERSLEVVRRKLLEEADMAGDSFFYAWGSGKNAIEGPSIVLAMSAIRLFGNCAVQMLPVEDSPEAWIMTARIVDLETGFSLERQFRQSKKHVVHGKHDDARKEDIRFQIGQSKAARNAIVNLVPRWIINQAMDQAKEGVGRRLDEKINAKGIAHVTNNMIAALGKQGVTEEMIFKKYAITKREAIDRDMLILMNGDRTALADGLEYVDSLYPSEGSAAKTGGKVAVGELPEKKTKAKKPAKEPTEEEQKALINESFEKEFE